MVDAGFKATLGVDVEVVTKDPTSKGFSVIKRRWVVEPGSTAPPTSGTHSCTP